MIREAYDVVIVGGGPAGCQTARNCAEEGLSVLLVEKDPDIGSPVRCAEGVGDAGLREFYEPDPSFTRQKIARLQLVAPDLTRVDVTLDQPGWILDRKLFDRRVAEDAARAGAQIITNTLATAVRRDGEFSVVTLNGCADVKAKVVVGADGTESRVGRWFGLRTFCKPRDMETAGQYLAAGVDVEPDRMEMWFGNEFAPGGYFWVFPKGPDVANIGLGISGDLAAEHTAFYYLDRMMERHYPNASIIGRTMGGIACSGGVKQIVADGCVLVGDAAHHANPLTGGGIVNSLKAGRMAAPVIAQAIRNDDWTAKALRSYEKAWDAELGSLHRRFYKIKDALFHLPDDFFTNLAHSIVELPVEKRTIRSVLTRAVANRPQLVLEMARVIF